MVLMDIAIYIVATITLAYKCFCISSRVIVVNTDIKKSIMTLIVVRTAGSPINNYKIDSIAISKVNIDFSVICLIYSQHIKAISKHKLVWM